MGEAARRKQAGQYPSPTTRSERTEPSQALIRTVAGAWTAAERVFADGDLVAQCWWRNQFVVPAARSNGLDSRLVVGGMYWKAGRGEADIVVFGDLDVRPRLPNLFHVWAEVRDQGLDWLVDITPRYWSGLPNHDDAPGYPPIDWECSPPDQLVIPRKRLAPTFRPLRRNTPPGAFWYGNESPALLEPVLGQIPEIREIAALAVSGLDVSPA